MSVILRFTFVLQMKLMTNLHFKTFLLIVSLLLFNLSEGTAQSKKRLKELERVEQDRNAEEASKSDEAKKRHKDIQSKQTLKEMKKYKKMSKNNNNNRREPFFKKWFRRNKH